MKGFATIFIFAAFAWKSVADPICTGFEKADIMDCRSLNRTYIEYEDKAPVVDDKMATIFVDTCSVVGPKGKTMKDLAKAASSILNKCIDGTLVGGSNIIKGHKYCMGKQGTISSCTV